MQPSPVDLAQVRLDNAMLLFEEFVRATARHADAATLRGLEKRFAERVQIQPSYWSQIKSRSRQIGERLARQFEHLTHKPRGWLDVPHGAGAKAGSSGSSPQVAGGHEESVPRDDDERFVVGLVLTYYRRHPQRARVRLLDLLGEVLTPEPGEALTAASARPVAAASGATAQGGGVAEDATELWQRSQTGVAPLKQRR